MAADAADIESDSGSDVARRPMVSPYSCCVMWTPIHPITWFLPFVGHMGICDSSGRLHDWGGGGIRPCPPREMMFGEPARYLKFNPADRAAWDAAIEKADREFKQQYEPQKEQFNPEDFYDDRDYVEEEKSRSRHEQQDHHLLLVFVFDRLLLVC